MARNVCNKTTFTICKNCALQLCNQDLSKHVQSCSGLNDTVCWKFTANTLHGLCSDRLAVLPVVKLTSDDNAKLKEVVGQWSNGMLLLSYDAMNAIGLKFGQPVVVVGSIRLDNSLEYSTPAVLIVWPYDGLRAFNCALLGTSSILLQNSALIVLLRRCGQQILSPNSLTLVYSSANRKTFYSSQQFLDWIKFKLTNSFLILNEPFTTYYFAQRCTLTPILDEKQSVRFINDNKLSNYEDALISKLDGIDLNSSFTVFCKSPPVKQSKTSSTTAFTIDLERFSLEYQLCQMNMNTNIIVKQLAQVVDDLSKIDQQLTTGFDAVGGMKIVKSELFKHIILPHRLNKLLIRTVLLLGASGTGKSLIGRALAAECKIELLSPGVVTDGSKFTDFQSSIVNRDSSCILLLDDLDRWNSFDISQMLDILSSKLIIVVATTNRSDKIDSSLRRRFDLEIECTAPNVFERADILRIVCHRLHCFETMDKSDLQMIADRTSGYTGADLLAVVRLASNDCTEEQRNLEYLNAACQRVRPTALREIAVDFINQRWSDIGGYLQVKLQLRQSIEWPKKYPDAFNRLGVRPPAGVLLYGPPGCSKTMIARALASETGINFVSVKGPELFSKWVGESERQIRVLFQRARQAAPCLIFFDELDGLAVERGEGGVGDRVLTQLLTELDGLEARDQNVMILAATNRPDRIDRALLRPGRIDRLIYVQLPDESSRRSIFELRFARMPVENEVIIEELVIKTAGYSGAEIAVLCNEAALIALQESMDVECVRWCHFLSAFESVKPRTDPELLKICQKFSSGN